MSPLYDAVIMLTWSDWKTEPRSNRYHYASRFAKHVPVLFVQPWGEPDTEIVTEKLDIDNITLVHGPRIYSKKSIDWFKVYLKERGIQCPLFWIYDSTHYDALLNAFPRIFRVYHATEDYITPTRGWNENWEDSMSAVGRSVMKLLQKVDFMVAVSQGVLDTYRTRGQYTGSHVLAENGCDADFFIKLGRSVDASEVLSRPVAIFQGGINARLDYDLLREVIDLMPDWDFKFCGKAISSEGWNAVCTRPNVQYLGTMNPDQFAKEMYSSTVGIIPYIQDTWIYNSLPLKAYEYVACGLPVVSVPIKALEIEKDLFTLAASAEEFVHSIRSAAETRRSQKHLEHRHKAALLNSYDARFSLMQESLRHAVAHWRPRQQQELNVLVLYDSIISMHVSTIKEHLKAFETYSRHHIHYVPATSSFWQCSREELTRRINLEVFDVIIIHYSVRLSTADHLHEGFADAMAESECVKVLFIQDEYEGTEIARQWMDRIGFDLVYTCVPLDEVEKVYPRARFPRTRFLNTLTGYVPEQSYIETLALPLRARTLRLAYRGRELPPIYGQLGHEKYVIGARMKQETQARNIPADIEVAGEKRLYGDDWYRFLGSARATLGTESGSTIFDEDGQLKRAITDYQAQHKNAGFQQVFEALLKPYEGNVRMNQISPKIFEAISLRTALVLFDGDYSGVVKPDVHYIPLRKDFSNLDDVFSKLEDLSYLEHLTERAYHEVVASGRYSYQQFVRGVDDDIQQHCMHSRNTVFYHGGLITLEHGKPNYCLPMLPLTLHEGYHDFPGFFELNKVDMDQIRVGDALRILDYRAVRCIWRGIPRPLKHCVVRCMRFFLSHVRSLLRMNRRLISSAKWLWRFLPKGLQIKLYDMANGAQ